MGQTGGGGYKGRDDSVGSTLIDRRVPTGRVSGDSSLDSLRSGEDDRRDRRRVRTMGVSIPTKSVEEHSSTQPRSEDPRVRVLEGRP